MQVNWNGVYPAVTTKFTTDFKLDIPAYKKTSTFKLNLVFLESSSAVALVKQVQLPMKKG